MDVYWIQQFWFDNFRETQGNLQRSFLTIETGGANVAVTAQLNVVAPGAHIATSNGDITGDLGIAAVGIKWYEYSDDSGTHHVDNAYFVPHLLIHNCQRLQVELASCGREPPARSFTSTTDKAGNVRVGLGPGPTGAPQRMSSHYVYRTGSGEIVASYHLADTPGKPEAERLSELLGSAHEATGIAIDELLILTNPDMPEDAGAVRVDHYARRLVAADGEPELRLRP